MSCFFGWVLIHIVRIPSFALASRCTLGPRHNDECHFTAIKITPNFDRFAGLEFARQKFHRQWILNQTLNSALQRSRTVDRIKTFASEQLFGALGNLHLNSAIGEHPSKPLNLNLDDLLQFIQPELLEDDHVVNPVQEFWLERCTQLLKDAVTQLLVVT